MLRHFPWACLLALVLTDASRAGEIGYLEDFALAPDRTQPLASLIPGSEDYYYYHCLHFQQKQQFDKVEELLNLYIQRYKDTPRLREIQNRQALLTYDAHPQQSLEFLQRRLDLHFNHQRLAPDAKPNLPTSLDPRVIDRETLTARATQTHPNLAGFEDAAFPWLVTRPLTVEQRRHLLERLSQPDFPKLPELIAAELAEPVAKPFGGLPIHRLLLLDQLDELLKLKPDLLNHTEFVTIYLAKLQPNDDVNLQYEPELREEYLTRVWDFVQKLAAAHNSLKAHVLFHRLTHDRARGVYDKDRFLAYLALPRRVEYIHPRLFDIDENQRFPVDLNADFAGTTRLSPVGNDEPLVRSYLQHFFVDETSTKPYETFIREDYLREVFAETKIVNGLGEPEKWYSLLPPEKYEALKERVDLDFPATNSQFFASDEAVKLDVDVKNVRTLIVKVFEIHAENYYRQQQREVNSDIMLDGLVANEEKTYQYDEPPLRRVRRHFEFPQLAKSGVYVVDFIGNGVSSRAVIRKGKLQYLVRNSTAGHLFTVFDENQKPVLDATLWMAGHEYRPDDQGRIVVPYGSAASRQSIVLSRGNLASLDEFQHEAESYELVAGIHVDRESLLSRKQARVLIRPALYLNKTRVTLSVLQDVRLLINSVDLDGVASVREVKDFKLFEDRESEFEFQVPPRLAAIQFALRAQVQNLSQNKKVDVASTESFQLNEIAKTDKIADVHLAKVGNEYILEMRGHTGESQADRPVQLTLKHRDFTEPVIIMLQTAQDGRIQLGSLPGIQSLTVNVPNGVTHTWTPAEDGCTLPQNLNGVAGQALELPFVGKQAKAERDSLSLLEYRGETPARDRFDALAVEDGLLRIQGLGRGDYMLLFRETGRQIRIRMAEGPQEQGFVLGRSRRLELRNQQALQIAAIDTQPDTIEVRLRGATPFARVHVFATRYMPAYSAFNELSRAAQPEPFAYNTVRPESLYVTGRNIGDEYRYIIDRKFAAKFPGNMLERPGLLLNPWAVRSTETGRQEAAGGEAFGAKAEPPRSVAEQAESAAAAAAPTAGFSSLDFLADASVVLINQVPDDKGVVRIRRDALGPHQQLHFVAVDAERTVYRTVALAEVPFNILDLRLSNGLDPKSHFTQQKRITALAPGEKLVLADLATSRLEVYDSVPRLYSLYSALKTDANLQEFRFLLEWPKLAIEKKRELYSKYASHELNFFLFKKDPAFFEAVVLPYLRNKLDKTFLDEWLIGAPLPKYLEPWRYERLNVVERILLSQRLAEDRAFSSQLVREQFELLPPDLDRFQVLFATALLGRALEVSEERDGVARWADLSQTRATTRSSNFAFGLPSGGAAGAVASGILKPQDSAVPPPAPAPESAPAPAAAAPASPPVPAEEPAPAADRPRRVAGRAARGVEKAGKDMAADKLAERGKEPANYYAEEELLRKEVRRLYQKLDKTQEWAENNYYHLPIEQQNADLVKVNAFWRDYAQHDPQKPFLSVNFAFASNSFTEIMFALALLDVPFEAGSHQNALKDAELTLTAAAPLVAFHEEIRPAAVEKDALPILVSQNFFRPDDRFVIENGQQRDKFITGEFLVSTVYGCQVVVTNPTSAPQKLDILLQIPVGAVPVLNAQATRSVQVDLAPYHTQTLEYHFYFPGPGDYSHYPVHIAKNAQLLASAQPVTLKVVAVPTNIDRTSWEYISQNGTNEDVLQFLRERNLGPVDLEKIAFRMQDAAFFRAALELLAKRHAYHATLWSYGLKHNDPAAVRQYLQHLDEFVSQTGDYLQSPLLSVDPVERKSYQFLEYRPLVNDRAHPLGRHRQIVNGRLFEQYQHLLKILSYKIALDADDTMSVVYYLLVQDRVEEARKFFAKVQPDQLETKLQYDYFAAYLAMYESDLDKARKLADLWREYPVDRWRNAFAELDQQIKEIAGADVKVQDKESRNQQQGELAATEPGFDFRVEGPKFVMNYQNLAQVRVEYYLMDVEVLFSRNPFVQQYSNDFSNIRPNRTDTLQLPKDKTSIEVPLPEELQRRNVLVSITGGGQSKSQAYYSNAMTVQVIENYGQLRVTSAGTGKPLGGVYVKVYAQMQDGSNKFYKDGYTDLRGRFDYTSLSTNELDFVKRFALLILSDENGALVREAQPPKH